MLFQFGIPVKKIPPAFMKEIGGEFSAVVLKFVYAGLTGGKAWPHPAFIGHLIPFLGVTVLTGSDNVFPRCPPAP